MIYKFLVKRNHGTPLKSFKPLTVPELPGKESPNGIYIVSPRNYILIDHHDHQTILLGDVILPEEEKRRGITIRHEIKEYFTQLKGTFYIIRIHRNEDRIEFASSVFGIFPIYFLDNDKEYLVSSDIKSIIDNSRSKLSVNKRFILELLLFYYPLFDQLIFKEISNLPANSVLSFLGMHRSVTKYLNIYDHFVHKPLPYQKYTDLLAELFIDNANSYFPDEQFYITFTGGFDGRTLVACAKHAGRNFKTYSIGDLTSDDINIPKADAQAIGIEYQPIYVDNQKYKELFLGLGSNLLLSSGLMNNMIYTHFSYAAKIISEKTEYILTGFGGSEIFRALDIRGAVTSHELVDFFQFSKNSAWKNKILKSDKLKLLNKNVFKNEINSLIEDLSLYQAKFDKSSGLNERIYIYLYEEVFRKVFGPTILNMSENLIVRNPYFDYQFNAELLKYSFAGVYSEFFVKNPIKRFKGQVLYGHIINKTSSILANRKTGKGYKPIDLIHTLGLFNISLNFVKKRVLRKIRKENLDYFSLVSGIELNQDLFLDLVKRSEYFDHGIIENLMKNRSYDQGIKERDILLLAFSLVYFLNMNDDKYILANGL